MTEISEGVIISRSKMGKDGHLVIKNLPFREGKPFSFPNSGLGTHLQAKLRLCMHRKPDWVVAINTDASTTFIMYYELKNRKTDSMNTQSITLHLPKNIYRRL